MRYIYIRHRSFSICGVLRGGIFYYGEGIAISMVGSAAVKSVMGVCTFSVIGILAGAIKEDKKKERVASHLMGR